MDNVPPFDGSLYYLGRLCKGGHGYANSEQTLRRIGNGDCIKCNKLRARESRKRNPRQGRANHLRRHYGVTLDFYERLLAEQQGVCAICRKPSEDQPLFVDHCHESLKIRGLLCSDCNFGLGYFKDSEDVLLTAVRYLAGPPHTETICRPGYRAIKRNSNFKLTMEQAEEIRSLYSTRQYNQTELGNRFGVSQCLISAIVLRKVYT